MSHASKQTLVAFGDSLSDNGNLFNLIGLPPPPYWEGRSSNGPTYAEQLAALLGAKLDDLAFAGALASDLSPPGLPLPINLSDQIQTYLAELSGDKPPPHTTAVINIGANDYAHYLLSSLPKDLSTAQTVIGNVIASIAGAINELTQAGVDNVVLYTLSDPDGFFAIAPRGSGICAPTGSAQQCRLGAAGFDPPEYSTGRPKRALSNRCIGSGELRIYGRFVDRIDQLADSFNCVRPE